MAGLAPLVSASTREQRISYVQNRFQCIGECRLCGNCAFLRGRDAEEVYADYIDGFKEFAEVTRSINT